MEVAEKAHCTPVRTQMCQDPHCRGFDDAFGRRRVALFIERAEVATVEGDIRGILAAEHGIRLGSRRDQNRARRQDNFFARPLVWLRAMTADLRYAVAGKPQRRRLPEDVD